RLSKSDLRSRANRNSNDVSWTHGVRNFLLRAFSFVIRHLLGASVFFITFRLFAADLTPEGVEFFEKKIRPVLVERCYKCHSAQAGKLKGGLRLDSREEMLKGGDTSPAIVPGDPDKSLLVETIRYRNPDSQMPPKGKLPDDQIADLVEWVKLGAPWPKQATAPAESAKKATFDLEKR